MKKIVKWIAIVLGVLVVAAFFGFLYFIPPFTLMPPQEFSKPVREAGPSLDGIADVRSRIVAERGKYLVQSLDCSGCHTPLGDEGPKWEEYLSGGNRTVFRGHGTFTTRNLTPDRETGLGRRSDTDVLRVLRSGLLPEGRVVHSRDMPWPGYAGMTEEDRYAILTYLRLLKPVYHLIPEDQTTTDGAAPGAQETYYTHEVAGHTKP